MFKQTLTLTYKVSMTVKKKYWFWTWKECSRAGKVFCNNKDEKWKTEPKLVHNIIIAMWYICGCISGDAIVDYS